MTRTAAFAPFGAITILRAVETVERVIDDAVVAWSERAARRHLARLSDHLLADIGVSERAARIDTTIPALTYRA